MTRRGNAGSSGRAADAILSLARSIYVCFDCPIVIRQYDKRLEAKRRTPMHAPSIIDPSTNHPATPVAAIIVGLVITSIVGAAWCQGFRLRGIRSPSAVGADLVARDAAQCRWQGRHCDRSVLRS